VRSTSTRDSYSAGEELAHALTHGIGAVLSVAALVVLVVYSALYGDAWHITSTSIYGLTLILLYTASTLYHGVSHPAAKEVLQSSTTRRSSCSLRVPTPPLHW